jgi:hypothetical protein
MKRNKAMEETMKRSVIVLIVLALFSGTASAEMGQMEQGQMQGEHQMMDMKQGDQPMKMECPKMDMKEGGQQMKCPKMKMMQGEQQMKTEGQKMDMKHGGHQMKMMHCQDTMQMIMSIVDIQEKILMGIKPEEKEKILQDIEQMKEKMQDMTSSCKGMMGGMMEKQTPAAAPAPERMNQKEPAMTEPHHMDMPKPNKE